MGIATVNISLPDDLRSFIEEQVREGGYASTSEYIRDLLRSDRTRRARERLERLLAEGLESGVSAPLTSDDWADLHSALDRQLAEANHGSGRANT